MSESQHKDVIVESVEDVSEYREVTFWVDDYGTTQNISDRDPYPHCSDRVYKVTVKIPRLPSTSILAENQRLWDRIQELEAKLENVE